jgi:hypothetical protein
MTRRSGDAYPDFQSVSHQPTGFSRWSLSETALFNAEIWTLLPPKPWAGKQERQKARRSQ